MLAVLFGAFSLFAMAPAQAQVAVSNLAAASGDGRLTLTWTNPQVLTSSDSILIRWKVQNTNNWLSGANGVELIASGNQNTWDITGLTNGTTYDVNVRIAVNGATYDNWVSTTGTPQASPPPDDDTDTEEPPTPEFTLSASPDPVPWDGAGAITVTVEWPTAQDSESVVVHIVEDGLCSWDHFRGNQAIVNIPSGQSRRSEKKENFNLARHEGYYNGEDCNKENKEDCKKCFFTWDASWATGTAGGVFVLSILPPPGSGPPTGGVPPTGGGPSPTGGGPSPGGGGSPPEGPSDPTPPSTPCGESDREYLERFYEASGGDAWHRNENWNSQEPLGEWFRVETDENGEVISLRLEENNLSGDMPTEELLCLNENTELKELALWDNEDLLGEVPEDLALAVERAALRAIAEMLDLNSEWFEDYEDPFNFEDWYERVTTDDDGRVTELELPGEIPESIRSQFKKRREITITTSDGGCALSPEGSSAFSLFLLTLVVFAVLGRRRAR